MAKKTKIPVLVTTDKDKRGVFFGYIVPEEVDNDPLDLYEAQMCIIWVDTKGVMGLAAHGPNPKCRIGAPVSKARLRGITMVAEVSEKAVKEWKKEYWQS